MSTRPNSTTNKNCSRCNGSETIWPEPITTTCSKTTSMLKSRTKKCFKLFIPTNLREFAAIFIPLWSKPRNGSAWRGGPKTPLLQKQNTRGWEQRVKMRGKKKRKKKDVCFLNAFIGATKEFLSRGKMDAGDQNFFRRR